MSRTILALALASSVSALLPAKVPVRVRGVYSAPLASSSALLSMRSRPPYMSIDPDTHAKIAAAGYASGFSDGLKAAAMVGAPTEAEAGPFLRESGQVIIDEVDIPDIPTSGDSVKGDKLLVQALATVCATIDESETAVYQPKDGDKVNNKFEQPYKVTDGGVGALDAFTTALNPYGTVIDHILDFQDGFEAALPPFAALVVQQNPKDETEVLEVRTLHPAPHPVSELCLVLLRECRPSPHLSRRG